MDIIILKESLINVEKNHKDQELVEIIKVSSIPIEVDITSQVNHHWLKKI
jgi:hypothetical protein